MTKWPREVLRFPAIAHAPYELGSPYSYTRLLTIAPLTAKTGSTGNCEIADSLNMLEG